MHGLLLGLAGAGALLVAIDPASTPPTPSAPQAVLVLDRREADFVEDEPGSRPVAALVARLERDVQGGVRLRLTASPTGARVRPPPGAYGVAGSNRISAEECATLLAEGRVGLLVRGPRGTTDGRLARGAPCPVLVRRLHADGRVSHEPLTGLGAGFVLEGEVALDGAGRHEVELVADGKVRVRAVCRVGRGEARILELRGISAHAGERP